MAVRVIMILVDKENDMIATVIFLQLLQVIIKCNATVQFSFGTMQNNAGNRP